VRHSAGFVVALNLTALGSLHAQSVACSPAAVTADPSPIDTAYPPMMRAVLIPSGGVRLNRVLYGAQGRGVHPTAVFLHGFPGDEKNADLAQAVRRAGFNAPVFYYRGAWGSPGIYSYSHVLEDARGTSGEELGREAVTHAGEWTRQRYAGVLATKRVLLVAATHPTVRPRLLECAHRFGARTHTMVV
jgi:hypothetical protein